MKKILLTILCLAFSSLACLSTSSAALESTEPAVVATRSNFLEEISEPIDLVGQLPTETRKACAVVVAVDALHLRETASPDAVVLTWLRSGDVVQVLSDSDPNWWRVSFNGVEGFARSTFLVNMECVQ